MVFGVFYFGVTGIDFKRKKNCGEGVEAFEGGWCELNLSVFVSFGVVLVLFMLLWFNLGDKIVFQHMVQKVLISWGLIQVNHNSTNGLLIKHNSLLAFLFTKHTIEMQVNPYILKGLVIVKVQWKRLFHLVPITNVLSLLEPEISA